MNHFDALGNEIVLGGSYGYSTTYEGNRTTVLGIAEKILDSGNVTLHITKRLVPRCKPTGQYVNGKATYEVFMEDITGSNAWGGKAKRTVSYGSDYLFPVQIQEIK